MGGALSSTRSCFPSVRTSQTEITPPQSPAFYEEIDNVHSPKRVSNKGFVILNGDDFGDGNLRSLVDRYPEIEISAVKFGIEEKLEDGHEWVPIDDDLMQLTALRSLTSLDLTGCREITRNGLARCSFFPHKIKTLILNDCPRITDNFFGNIAHYSRLEKLYLRGCFRISEDVIRALTVLKYLRHLDISFSATQQTSLISQDTTLSSVSDAVIPVISRMKQLRTLQMEQGRRVTDQGILRLCTLQNITSLNLSDTGLTDHGLVVLGNFPRLRCLNVGGCQISEIEFLHRICPAKGLKHLNVSRTPVTEKFLHAASMNFALERLDMDGCDQLTDRCINHLRKLTSLRHLSINGCRGITKYALRQLNPLTGLRSLHISEIMLLECEDLRPFRELHELEMRARSADDEHLSQLAALKNLTDLKLHLPVSSGLGEPSLCIKVLGIKVHLLRDTH